MRRLPLATCVVLMTGALASAQEARRELGPHVHGAGTLSIAIEDNKISMDFSAPAQDILGFEHQPSTPEQAKVLATAKKTLALPLGLFGLPAAAGCSVTSAEVKFNAADPVAAGAKPADAEAQHADFDNDYVFTCTAADKVTAITFPYFQLFPGAQKLSVTVVTATGQAQFDVTRDNPKLALK